MGLQASTWEEAGSSGNRKQELGIGNWCVDGQLNGFALSYPYARVILSLPENLPLYFMLQSTTYYNSKPGTAHT
jgi:hypothetical protein